MTTLAQYARLSGLVLAGLVLTVGFVWADAPDYDVSAPEIAPASPDLMAKPLLPNSDPLLIDESKYDHVNWRGVLGQSFRFLLVQQAFRYSTEAATRSPHQNFFDGYRNSVTNLHGWADGDPFIVNYVGHPMQGAVSGYIWVQNDGRYRFAQFGKNRDYWESRLRATAFAFAYSAQFEIGLVSEASIGHTQSYFPQQGFVDIVATPTIGLAWMMAEDALDRYFIRWYETKTSNPYYILLVRSWLNPSRSFANIFAGNIPWHRDTRPGLFGKARNSYQPVALQPIPPREPEGNPRIAPFEFSLYPTVQVPVGNTVSGPCVGGGADGGFRLGYSLQIVVAVNGCNATGLYTNLSGDMLNFSVGPRWTFGSSTRWIPYVEVLAGGMKITHEEMYPDKKAALQALWESQGRQIGETEHNLYTRQAERSGFAMSVGGGINRRLNNALSWRVASVDYTRGWVGSVDGYNYTNSIQITSGLLLKMGTW